MPRYIDVDSALQAHPEFLNEQIDDHDKAVYAKGWNACNSAFYGAIKELPTVSPDDARGVGKWIMLENQSKEDTDNGNYWYTCSHCSAGDLHAKVQEVPFCWKCGARMKGADGSE